MTSEKYDEVQIDLPALQPGMRYTISADASVIVLMTGEPIRLAQGEYVTLQASVNGWKVFERGTQLPHNPT